MGKAIEEDRIQAVWDWCSEAYLRHGKRLTFPANTDRKKTYQWRYARAIANKFQQWDFDDQTARKFIDIAVNYAKQKGSLHKGLAVLHQSNMLDVCYKKLQEQSDKNGQELDVLASTKKWFDQVTDGNTINILLHRADPRSFSNLTIWYRANRLSPLFLALSHSCTSALTRLQKDNPDERTMLPTAARLFSLRSKIVQDLNTFKQARRIFKTDWRELCP